MIIEIEKAQRSPGDIDLDKLGDGLFAVLDQNGSQICYIDADKTHALNVAWSEYSGPLSQKATANLEAITLNRT